MKNYVVWVITHWWELVWCLPAQCAALSYVLLFDWTRESHTVHSMTGFLLSITSLSPPEGAEVSTPRPSSVLALDPLIYSCPTGFTSQLPWSPKPSQTPSVSSLIEGIISCSTDTHIHTLLYVLYMTSSRRNSTEEKNVFPLFCPPFAFPWSSPPCLLLFFSLTHSQ